MSLVDSRDPPGRVTRLLAAWRGGDDGASEELARQVYPELCRIARRCLVRERRGHTLEPAALVHEVYLRLAAQRDFAFANRAHFFAIAARLMRRVLVDHERRRRRLRRAGGALRVTLPPDLASLRRPTELRELDAALERLSRIDPRRAAMIELRFFGGLTLDETAEALGCSRRTVAYDWRLARAWLIRELGGPR